MRVLQGGSFNNTGTAIGLFFSEKLGKIFSPPFLALAFEENEEIKAAVLFNDYTKYNIEAHIYAPHAITRARIRVVLSYVFTQLQCGRLTAKFERSNNYLKEILPRLGFTYEATLSQYYGPGIKNDALVYVLTREHAKKWTK